MQENVAILILCQINRSADNIKPTMANLKESGSIEEDSDNVILLHKLDKDTFFSIRVNARSTQNTYPLLNKPQKNMVLLSRRSI